MKHELADEAAKAADKVEKTVGTTWQDVKSRVSDHAGQARQTAAHALDTAHDVADDIKDRIQSRPVAAVLGAGLVGLLIGILVSR